ncbi:DUF2752 domain-containing protein [Demequina zhanjiangensis]|uniref:DUF2752 domain-containing protein n=1 Tax=Demequina zhanjiangensis TaxID=3051659 RepID=A0ABT8G2H2_9MICO|nr:DUF2752 domain-containing protein [Demequina sp. SYSU T00b26]MDN4473139.1 DUF2752 domain-containing protein [Demequina sp. SYSU T00b26]
MTAAAVTDRRTPHRLAGPAVVTAALLAGTAYTGVQDPTGSGVFPSCIFFAATGHWCPGCGGLRAVHSLLGGDLALALQYNVVVVLLIIPMGIAAIALWWYRAWRRKGTIPVPMWFAIGLPALLGVFWIVRNLPPFAPYLTV